jgi:hypothetical protein
MSEKTVVTVSPSGTRQYFNPEKVLHREDGPAVEWPDGGKEYWINGERHREGGPAIEYASGTRYYYIRGKRHREDGPAIEWADGGCEYWVHGRLHREDGPAVELPGGTKGSKRLLGQQYSMLHP